MIKQGDTVSIHYTGKLENGEIFDSSEGKEPLQFKVGEGRMIKGIEESVMGMEKGQQKKIKIMPSEAYGDVQQNLIQQIPKNALPEQIQKDVKEGMFLQLQDPQGQVIPVRITKVEGSTVTLNLNHPLAGKVLDFEVKIADIS